MYFNKKFVLGTAQFGFDYGVLNQTGKMSLNDTNLILNYMKDNKIKFIDTASSYNDSEEILGNYGMQEFKVITKFLFYSADYGDLVSWINNEISKSKKKLKVDKFYAILIHDFDNLSKDKIIAIFDALNKIKNKFFKVGISTYKFQENLELLNKLPLDIIQTNYNIFDRRLENFELKKMIDPNIEIFARSIFLQGILVNAPSKLPIYFKQFSEILENWYDFLKKNNYDAIHYCINFVLSNDSIDKIVIGVDDFTQFKKIVAYDNKTNYKKISFDKVLPLELINPPSWN